MNTRYQGLVKDRMNGNKVVYRSRPATWAEGGVLGVLPGIIGSLQANEVIKVITGVGEPLSGRFFVFDALTFETRTLKITKRANSTEIKELIDYEQFCGISAIEKPVKEISTLELENWISNGEDFQIIDVRETSEYEQINIGAHLIPLGEVIARNHEIEREKKVVIHCRSGARSAKAIHIVTGKQIGRAHV